MSKQKTSVTDKYTTGKGELVGFIGVMTPSTKFNKDGVYSANILISKAEGEKLAAKIKDIRTQQYKTYGKGSTVQELTKCIPFVEVVKNEEGEVVKESPDKDGRYILKTSAKAFIENGKPRVKIPVFDAKQNPVGDVRIGEGTTAKLALSLEGYTVANKTGVSVKLKAVQIIDLVEYGTGNAESYGFDEEEGFESSGEVAEEGAETTNDESDEESDF